VIYVLPEDRTLQEVFGYYEVVPTTDAAAN